MWKFWVAAVAVAVSVFAGVVVLGLRAVDSDPEPTPVAAPIPKPVSWAERASAHCVNSLDTVRAALTNAASRPTESPKTRSVRLFVETTAIEGRLVANLRAIPGPPDRAKADEAIGRFAEQHAKDVLVGRRLQRRYDEQLLRRAVAEYEREATRLRGLFRQLGATGCVSYFNPSSYE
jgi:hypothetical protein